MFIPVNEVKTLGEWHFSQAMPAAGTWVEDDGAVGEPPASSGIILG
jgi:hypothetical protein